MENSAPPADAVPLPKRLENIASGGMMFVMGMLYGLMRCAARSCWAQLVRMLLMMSSHGRGRPEARETPFGPAPRRKTFRREPEESGDASLDPPAEGYNDFRPEVVHGPQPFSEVDVDVSSGSDPSPRVNGAPPPRPQPRPHPPDTSSSSSGQEARGTSGAASGAEEAPRQRYGQGRRIARARRPNQHPTPPSQRFNRTAPSPDSSVEDPQEPSSSGRDFPPQPSFSTAPAESGPSISFGAFTLGSSGGGGRTRDRSRRSSSSSRQHEPPAAAAAPPTTWQAQQQQSFVFPGPQTPGKLRPVCHLRGAGADVSTCLAVGPAPAAFGADAIHASETSSAAVAAAAATTRGEQPEVSSSQVANGFSVGAPGSGPKRPILRAARSRPAGGPAAKPPIDRTARPIEPQPGPPEPPLTQVLRLVAAEEGGGPSHLLTEALHLLEGLMPPWAEGLHGHKPLHAQEEEVHAWRAGDPFAASAAVRCLGRRAAVLRSHGLSHQEARDLALGHLLAPDPQQKARLALDLAISMRTTGRLRPARLLLRRLLDDGKLPSAAMVHEAQEQRKTLEHLMALMDEGLACLGSRNTEHPPASVLVALRAARQRHMRRSSPAAALEASLMLVVGSEQKRKEAADLARAFEAGRDAPQVDQLHAAVWRAWTRCLLDLLAERLEEGAKAAKEAAEAAASFQVRE